MFLRSLLRSMPFKQGLVQGATRQEVFVKSKNKSYAIHKYRMDDNLEYALFQPLDAPLQFQPGSTIAFHFTFTRKLDLSGRTWDNYNILARSLREVRPAGSSLSGEHEHIVCGVETVSRAAAVSSSQPRRPRRRPAPRG
eukprot:RCo035685